MSEEPYQHREHDHLVEPLFGGIHGAHDHGRAGSDRRAGGPAPALGGALWTWLALAAVAAALLVPL